MPSISRNGSPSMSMRSAKVPLSPSSALQTMYFCSAGASSTVLHLMPVGKPGTAASAQPGLCYHLDDPGRRERQGTLQAFASAVSAVGVERQRIDDAATGEGEAGLAREPADPVDRPEILGCACRRGVAPRSSPSLTRRANVGGLDRPEAVAHAADLHLDQRLQPHHAARAGAHDLHRLAGRRAPWRTPPRRRRHRRRWPRHPSG